MVSRQGIVFLLCENLVSSFKKNHPVISSAFSCFCVFVFSFICPQMCISFCDTPVVKPFYIGMEMEKIQKMNNVTRPKDF